MKKYEYKFVQVTPKASLKSKKGDSFKECEEVIVKEAQAGWRLKQVVIPFNEKTGAYFAFEYQIIFEKEVE